MANVSASAKLLAMSRRIVFILALLVSAAPASAMSVDEFLTRAATLEKKGVAALFSSDYKLLRNEVKSAGEALRASEKTARAAGRKPVACLPDRVPVKSDELLAYFRAIPQGRRNITVAAAFTEMMSRKYPCPG